MVLRYIKPPSIRQLRVAESIKKSIIEVITRNELPIPMLEKTFITISEVRISPDLKLATIFVATMMDVNKEEILYILNDSQFMIKHLVAKKVNLKFIPVLRFAYDSSFEEGAKINGILHKIK